MIFRFGHNLAFQLQAYNRRVCLRASSTGVVSIRKLLVANRGEIACRICRTAKRLGIRTVAVFSDVDRHALHVSMADEAYCIGEAPSSESYLRADRIVDVALRSRCHAVHPGYGFLSENAQFAALCRRHNLIFVGPSASAIHSMGIKSLSKELMKSAGVPVVPGYHGDDQSDSRLEHEAHLIGYPVMIKAVMGGGGKGMRIVNGANEFLSQLNSARNEARKSFSDSDVLLEKYISRSRHIEVQVFGDAHDNYVYLFERDCSVQRRHQKIIEEAPAPHVHSGLRERLGTTAVQAARAVQYVGAGTVEFIVDADDLDSFYFMEMNTRLQVEHPVTEMVTNTDLVEWQIQVSEGRRLPLLQSQLQLCGHALEARVYAESPERDFIPLSGQLEFVSAPTTVPGSVRLETGVSQGDTVSVYYDPMISKLVVWSECRETALQKLHKQLDEYAIYGLHTNIAFLSSLVSHEDFRAARVDSDFIARNLSQLISASTTSHSLSHDHVLLGALLIYLVQRRQNENRFGTNLFYSFGPFQLNRLPSFCVELIAPSVECISKVYISHCNTQGSSTYVLKTDEHLEKKFSAELVLDDGVFYLNHEVDGCATRNKVFFNESSATLFHNAQPITFQFGDAVSSCYARAEHHSTSNGDRPDSVVAPMPGLIDRVCVGRGASVTRGDMLVTMTAMKMEYVIRSTRDGVVEDILCAVGDNVSKDQPLIHLCQS